MNLGRIPIIGLSNRSRGRSELDMTRDEAEMLIRIEPVLKKLHLSLFCTRCHAAGEPDGVRAANSASDAKWLVECGCSVRMHQRHAGPSA